MNKLFNKSICLLLLTVSSANCALIINEGNAGWLGDQLLNYIKAKYLSHKYGIPFALRPFSDCNKFVLDDVDRKVMPHSNGIWVINEAQLNPIDENAIYHVIYQCHIDGWRTSPSLEAFKLFSLTIDFWDDIYNDTVFISEMKRLIALKNNNISNIPQNVSLAIHVRRPLSTDTGSNIPVFRVIACNMYDFSELIRQHEIGEASEFYKFLPDQYYIDQLIRFAKMVPGKQIDACIFTNHYNPLELCEHYRRELEKNNVLNISLVPQSWVSGTAEELVAMSQFEYLIRSRSNYSQIADFIGNHKIVISPGDLALYKDSRNRDCAVVETVMIKTKNEDGSYKREIFSNM